MQLEQYREKLIRFNSTEKYFEELKTLQQLLDVRFGETILDYGCGIGSAISYMTENTKGYFLGYDIVDYNEGKCNHVPGRGRDPKNFYVNYLPSGIDKVYFMHSFAHIENISEVLETMRYRGISKIYVVTPNLNWLNQMHNDKYVPDPTVKQHYTINTLRKVLEDAKYSAMVGEIGAKCEGYRERLIAKAELI